MAINPVRMTLGILIIVIGVSCFVFYLVTSLTKFFGGLERIEVPGARDLPLEPGEYSLYWETTSRFTTAPSLSDVDISIQDRGGNRFPVSGSVFGRSRYSTADRVAVSLGRFTVERQDVYSVKVGPVAGKSLPKGGITLGRAMGFLGVVKIVLVSILLMGGGIGGGLAVLLRKRAPSTSRPPP